MGIWKSDTKLVASNTIYIDCNRTDTYVENGTIQYPYKKISNGLSTVTSAFAVHLASGSYTETGDLSLPAYPMTVYGNKSTLTCTGTITINEVHSIYDLNTVGSIIYAYTGSSRSTRSGGSINGTVTIQGGFPHFDSLNYTGNMTMTGGNPYFRTMTGGGRLILNGASVVLSLSDCNLNMNLALSNITVTLGQLIINGSIFVNNGTVPNITISNTNTLTTAHAFAGVLTNWLACGTTAYTLLAPTCVITAITGSLILSTLSVQPAVTTFGVGGGVAQTQTITMPLLASAYVGGMRIAYVISVSNTGANPTINLNGLGAKVVIKANTTAIAANDLLIGMIADLYYDGTYFRLMNPAGV
jgi:hypothetical protein